MLCISACQVLEALYCKQWTELDGVGALIITPTRELAYQIFETLRKVGHYHDVSAGLIIGRVKYSLRLCKSLCEVFGHSFFFRLHWFPAPSELTGCLGVILKGGTSA